MNNSQKAIRILEQTHDGSMLSPEHLYLVQLGCNNHLAGEGQQAFDELFAKVSAGSYVRPWLHGVEHLTKAHSGYIYWKGVQIEHFSFHDHEAEKAAAIELGERCRSAEARGFPVTGRTTSDSSPFASAPSDTPWAEAMSSYYTMFAAGGTAKWLILDLADGCATAIAVIGGEVVARYALDSLGALTLYHCLQGEGMTSCGERLRQYDSFVACMEEAGLTPEIVHRVLTAGIPGVSGVTNESAPPHADEPAPAKEV